jgi:hypothetical protein
VAKLPTSDYAKRPGPLCNRPSSVAQLVGAVINEEAGCLRGSDYGEMGSGPLPRMASSLAGLQNLEKEFGLRADTRTPSFGVA